MLVSCRLEIADLLSCRFKLRSKCVAFMAERQGHQCFCQHKKYCLMIVDL